MPAPIYWSQLAARKCNKNVSNSQDVSWPGSCWCRPNTLVMPLFPCQSSDLLGGSLILLTLSASHPVGPSPHPLYSLPPCLLLYLEFPHTNLFTTNSILDHWIYEIRDKMCFVLHGVPTASHNAYHMKDTLKKQRHKTRTCWMASYAG